MDKEKIVFQHILQEAYEKGENEQISVQELLEELTLKLREMIGER